MESALEEDMLSVTATPAYVLSDYVRALYSHTIAVARTLQAEIPYYKQCHLKDKYVTSFTVLTKKLGKEIRI
jgi:hypothetical protein